MTTDRTSPQRSDSVQTDLNAAIALCNDVTTAIAAHQRTGKYDAETLLELIDGYVREARQLIETAVTPP